MKPSRIPWLLSRWPLIEQRISRADCFNWMQSHEYSAPPRSSCVFCPYHSNAEWRRLKMEEPEEFQRAVEFEIELQKGKRLSDNFNTIPYLHSLRQPLESIDFTNAEDNGQGNLFGRECEGICGV